MPDCCKAESQPSPTENIPPNNLNENGPNMADHLTPARQRPDLVLAILFCAVFISFASIAIGQDSSKTPAVKKDSSQADTPLATFRGHATELTALAFSADGRQAVSVSEKEVCIWDPATGKEIRRLKVDGESAVAFNRDFSRLVIARSFHFDVPEALRGTLTLRDTANGKDVWSIEPHGDWNRDVPFVPAIGALVFSPDGKRLATAGGVTKVRGHLPKGMVKIWDVETGKELRQLDELSARADAVAFSADGTYLAAGTLGASGEAPIPGEVLVWDITTGQRLHAFKTRPDVEQGGNPGSVITLAFNPRGTRLAAGVSDGTVRLWELPSGKELFEMRGHQGGTGGSEVDKFTGMILRRGSVRSVAFSPDGTRLASAGYDRVMRVWDTETGEQAKTYRFDSARINAVAFTPDGQRIAAGGSNNAKSGEAIIWKMSYDKEKVAGSTLPTLRKAEMAQFDSEVRSQIENAVKTEDKQWQDLELPRRGIKDRVVKVLGNTPAMSDQQVVSAVYLLTVGRPPTDEEVKRAQKEFGEIKNRPLSVLQITRVLAKGKEFSTEISATNDRLFKMQKDLSTKRGAGETSFLLTADEFQKLTVDCASSVDKAVKTDEQFVDLAYLLALSRFPKATESTQAVTHLKKAADRATATKEIFFSLLNSKEFLVPK